jgi:hypothetical protein
VDLLLFLQPKLVALHLIVAAYDFCARFDTHFMFDLLVFLVPVLFSSFKHFSFLAMLPLLALCKLVLTAFFAHVSTSLHMSFVFM